MAKFTSNTVIIDDIDIIEYIKENYYPEDVFDVDKLSVWAEENEYIKKDYDE